MFTSFKDMPVWQNAIKVAEVIFQLSEKLPKKEDYGLISQIRRSAVSISANIAEAYGRNHTADKANFYYYARGSIVETQSHLEYGMRVGYFDKETVKELDEDLTKLYNDVNKIIVSFGKKKK